MKRQNMIVVVGDRFTAFQRHKGVVGVSDFCNTVHELSKETKVVFGQGLGDNDIVNIKSLLLKYSHDLLTKSMPSRVDQSVTHKHFSQNVAISTPEKRTSSIFASYLLLDERNEILSDHLTGEHIQGLALVEAARQMWTAVTELFLRKDKNPIRLVLDNVSAHFQSYVLPLPTEMRMQVHDLENADVGFKLSCSVDFLQENSNCASVDAKIRSVPSKIAEMQEILFSRRVLESIGNDDVVVAQN